MNLSAKQREFAIAFGLVMLVFLVFGQALHYGYCDMDDGLYVVRNAYVQAGPSVEGILWALSPRIGHWHPLTWWSLMADTPLFKTAALGHHLVNLLLHAAGSVVLFVLLRRMTGAVWRSGMVAALFAIHPLHVEPVVWISSRKDVLSTLFLFLMLLAYVRYSAKPTVWRYMGVAFLFLLGLASKTMLVTAPVLLLLLDFWPLQRWAGAAEGLAKRVRLLIAEKIPLLLLSGFAAGMAYLAAQQEKVIGLEENFPLAMRLANGVNSYAAYVGKTLWPFNLAIFYPYLDPPLPLWRVVVTAALLLAVTLAAVLVARRLPYLCVGWLWYLISLLPVIGIIQIGAHSMADRYAYVPVVGLFVAGVWGVTDVLGRGRWRAQFATGLAAALIVFLAGASYVQVRYWRDGVTLFSHSLRVTADNAIARNNLGFALLQRGYAQESLAQFEAALRMHPGHVESLVNAAIALGTVGRTGEAEALLREAVRLKPNHAFARFNLGVARLQQGDDAGAIEQFAEAVRIDPMDTEARYAHAESLARQGKRDEALDQVKEILRINPNHAAARNLDSALR